VVDLQTEDYDSIMEVLQELDKVNELSDNEIDSDFGDEKLKTWLHWIQMMIMSLQSW
jgi:hypothetical protein